MAAPDPGADATDAVIRVHGVSIRFNIHKDKSLKERLVNFGRSAQHAEAFWALRDVSLDVPSASTLAIIGHNGSGKSTLLKIIGGIIRPTEGYVERRGRLAALLELGAGFHGDLTGRENVFLNASILGLSRAQTESYFDEIVDFSGIEEFIDTQVKFYSSGMYVRLAFAVAVHVDPEILLVDEVLAVGDEPFQLKCLDRIKRFQSEGRTIVLVTHGLDTVRELCDRAILLERGRVLVDGSPLEAVRTFRERYEHDAAQMPEGWEGSGEADISDVVVLGPDGTPRERFAPGDTLTLQYTVSAKEPLEAWISGVAIANHFDQVVYGTTSERLGHSFEPFGPGRRVVRWNIPALPFAEGQYRVDIDIAGPAHRKVMRRVDRVASFQVVSDSDEDGVVHLDPKIEVLPAADDRT